MPTYDVSIEVLYHATVQVEARTRREARDMAERGPAAWYGEPLHKEHLSTHADEAWRQGTDDGDLELA